MQIMARASNKLSAVEVKGMTQKGMYHDGGRALSPSEPRRREVVDLPVHAGWPIPRDGLGAVHTIPLAEARKTRGGMPQDAS